MFCPITSSSEGESLLIFYKKLQKLHRHGDDIKKMTISKNPATEF